MITLPFTQVHLFVSMIISEIFILSDPSYTVKIGSTTYFSLAFGAFVGIIFVIVMLAIKFGSNYRFKNTEPFPRPNNTKAIEEKTAKMIKVKVN